MLKKGRLIIVFGVILSGSFFAPHEGWAITAKYQQVMAAPDGTELAYNVLVSGKKIRMETDFGGERRVLLFNADGMYTYFPERNLYVKMPKLPETEDVTTNPIEFVEQLKSKQTENLGSEAFNGYLCDVYRYRDEATSSIVTVWVWKDKSFPIKIGFAGGLAETTVTFRNIELDLPVADDAFKLPAGAVNYNPDSLGAMFEAFQKAGDSTVR